MSVIHPSVPPPVRGRARRVRPRAALALSAAVLLAAGLVPAVGGSATAAPVPADAAHSGLFGSGDPTYDGVFRQSLAILGLHAAGETPNQAAVGWLLDQQCTDGGFMYFNPTPSAACATYDATTFSGGEDVDATSLAAQALRAVGLTTEAASAESWLVAHQDGGGGWESPVGSGYGPNPNSTGLALTALAAAGATPTHDTTAFFAGLQIGRGLGAADADKGGIAAPYQPTVPDVLSTVQSVPGLVGADLVNVPAPSSATWTAGTTTFASTPAADAAHIADWATTWLATQSSTASFKGNAAWAVLSFAANKTGRTAALAAYTGLAAKVAPADPGALGQAALAATALGRTTDAQHDATLIAATLTPSTGRDPKAPATFTLSRTSAWTGQAVTVGNPDANYAGSTLHLTESVAWGDGSHSTLRGVSASHRYAKAGTFHPVVTLTYQGNALTATVPFHAVKVTRDVTRPTVSLTRPAKPHSAASWKTIRGTSHDSGSGVATVTLILVEKHAGHWYAYTGRHWVRKASHAKATAAAKRIAVKVGTTGAWSRAVAKPYTGSLSVTYLATDHSGNRSARHTKTVTLTK